MEIAALLTLACLRGVQMVSILNNVVIYNQPVQESVLNYSLQEKYTLAGETSSIVVALETLHIS